MWRWIALAAAVLVAAAAWVCGVATVQGDAGFFAPLFAPAGDAVYAVRRETRATVLGFGYEFFSPPATVFLHRDRYALVRIRLRDSGVDELVQLPPSPLQGTRLTAYHGAIYGTPAAHLRWTGAQLSFEVGSTTHQTPQSRTFVARGVWDPVAERLTAEPVWQEGPTTMGGLEAQQIAGGLEVAVVPGDESMPCAVVTLDAASDQVRTLVRTGVCQRRYGSAIPPAVVRPLARRTDIERWLAMTRAHDAFVKQRMAAGDSEVAAMLAANKEMERLGYYPKSTTIRADASECSGDVPAFAISDEEFVVGLFPDIADAIASPGTEFDKSIGSYVMHQSFDTSARLNEFLSSQERTAFDVRTSKACWRITLTRP